MDDGGGGGMVRRSGWCWFRGHGGSGVIIVVESNWYGQYKYDFNIWYYCDFCVQVQLD